MSTRIERLVANSCDFTGLVFDTRVPQAVADAMHALDTGSCEVQGEYKFNSRDGATIISARLYNNGEYVCDLVDFGGFDAHTMEHLERQAEACRESA